MISCLVVDDEQHSIDVLEHYVGQCSYLHLIAATTSPVEALNHIASGKVDLLFVDVHMPDISGIDIIKSISGACKVILTTAYQDYALEGYDLGVADYLLKPISYPRFLQAVQKVSSDFQIKEENGDAGTGQGYIYIKTGLKNNVVRINYQDIEYIESLKNYAAIYHGGKKTVAYLSMKDLEGTLPPNQFLRIHKSFIISLTRIVKVEGNEIELTGLKTRINIGESYKAKLWSIIRERILG
jgi:DNA-binding LytR/AlgR family response regulator